jgi:micrococcal nuclease
MWEYRCRVVDVYDGDTLTLDVDLGFNVTNRVRVRLLDIDTPEIRGEERPEGLLAKQFVMEWIAKWEHSTSPLAPIGDDDWPFIVRTKKTGKYGRWLADIFAEHTIIVGYDDIPYEASLVEALKDAGHDTEDWKEWK